MRIGRNPETGRPPTHLAIASALVATVLAVCTAQDARGQLYSQYVDDPSLLPEPGFRSVDWRQAKFGVPLVVNTYDGIKTGLVCNQAPPAIFTEQAKVKSLVFRRLIQHKTMTSRARFVDCSGSALQYLQRIRVITRTGLGNYPILARSLTPDSDLYVEKVRRYRAGLKGWPVESRVLPGETTQGFRLDSIKTPRVVCNKVTPTTDEREVSAAYLVDLYFDHARVVTPRVSLPATEAYRVLEQCDPSTRMTGFFNPTADLTRFRERLY